MVYPCTQPQLQDSLEIGEKRFYIWGKFSANCDGRNSTKHHLKFNKAQLRDGLETGEKSFYI